MSDLAEFSVVLLSRVANFLNLLTPQQVKDLVDNKARLALVAADEVVVAEPRPRSRRTSKSDPEQIAHAIRSMSSAADVYTHLESLPKVNIDALMAVAQILDVSVERSRLKKQVWQAIANAWADKGTSNLQPTTIAPTSEPPSTDRDGDGYDVGNHLDQNRTQRLEALAEDLPGLATREDVVTRLEREGLTTEEMRQLARILKVTVPSGKTRVADIRSVIAEATVGYRLKASAIFQGTWPK